MPTETQVEASPAVAPNQLRVTRRVRTRPILSLGTATILFLVSTYLAFRPEPWPGAFGRPLSSRSWSTLLPGSVPSLPTYNVSFRSITRIPGTNTLLAVGNAGAVAQSLDGGRTWDFTARWTGNATDFLNNISFADSATGWVAGFDGTILRTDNGGATWTRQHLPDGASNTTLQAVYPFSKAKVLAAGWFGSIFLSHDGGQTWSQPASGTNSGLNSIDFANPEIGLIVGNNGVILRTADGGQTWRPIDTGYKSHLNCVRFSGAQTAWIVGLGGMVLTSGDAGLTWKKIDPGTTQDLYSMIVRGPNAVAAVGTDTIVSTIDSRGWTHIVNPVLTRLTSLGISPTSGFVAVGLAGSILTSPDGRTWKPYSMGGLGFFNGVRSTEQGTWVATNDGQILASNPNGALFRPIIQRKNVSWMQFCFSPDGENGLVVGYDGQLLNSRDGGRTWRGLKDFRDPNPRLTDCSITDASNAWIAGDRLWSTTDSGEHWAPVESATDRLTAIAFLDAKHGVYAGNANLNKIYFTQDGGQSWSLSKVSGGPIDPSFTTDRIIYLDAAHLWLVGTDGLMMHSEDAGRTWIATKYEQTELSDVAFTPDGKFGWVVGLDGAIGTTSDGGKNWDFKHSQNYSLHSISFRDSKNGTAVGWGGTILQSSDGGQTWKRYEAPWWPSGWYYLSWLLVGLIAAPAFRRPPPDIRIDSTIANKLVSDRPIEAGEPDAFGLSKVARGLSRFLRNENTVPPLTIAVTGQWGSGKSSLMNLLAADLRANRFRPVFFNAWHNQQEHNVLASLLDAIRRKGLPSLGSVEGVIFRTVLLLRRCREHWVFVSFCGLLLAASAGLLEAHPQWLSDPWQKFIQSAPGYVQALASGPGKNSPAWLTFVISAITAIAFLARCVKAFGVKPEEILTSARTQGDKRKPYHLRFADQFRDVTAALAPRRLVILVDDLDRCRPQYVLDTLEAINFLISSGECFIVMGLAPDQVKAAVGLAFKDIAEEMVTSEPVEPGSSAEDQSRKKRDEYARQYLYKLVNMEIPVPDLDASGATRVLDGVGVEPPPSPGRIAAFKPYALVAALTVLLVGTFFLAQNIAGKIQNHLDTRLVKLTKEPNVNAAPPSVAPPQPGAQPAKAQAAEAASTFDLTTGGHAPFTETSPLPSPHPIRFLIAAPLFLLLGASISWVLKTRINVVVHDSEGFTLALELWQPILSQLFLTPRALKRFLNKVRYLAMLQRPTARERNVFSTLFSRSDAASSIAFEAGDALRETALVALAALQEIDGNTAIRGIDVCKATHIRRFGDPLNEAQRSQFLNLSQGVKVG